MTFDEQIAARTLWQECRGEPHEGQDAVAHVLWNRVRDGRWGHTLASVCLWPLQFSGWNVHDPNRLTSAAVRDDDTVLLSLLSILDNAETSLDPTKGATHYYAVSMPAPPDWIQGATYCGQFGRQKFYKDVD